MCRNLSKVIQSYDRSKITIPVPFSFPLFFSVYKLAAASSTNVTGNITTKKEYDSPALQLITDNGISIIPPNGGSTAIDVTETFSLWAIVQFEADANGKKVFYPLGKTTWSSRFQGTVSVPAGGGNPTFAKGVNNANNNSQAFTRSNALPTAYKAPYANLSGSNWR